MAVLISDRGRRHVTDLLVGRDRELQALTRLGVDERPFVVFLHGVAGIGKSTLLERFAGVARADGSFILRLDSRMLEPTDRGVLETVAAGVGASEATIEVVAARLADLRGRAILVFDHVEVLRLLDTWLRQAFVPAMPDNVRLVFAGREPPLAAWLTSVDLVGSVTSMPLTALEQDEAVRLFELLGVSAARAARLNRIVRGHPLAITLAAAAAAGRADLGLDDVAAHAVLDELTRIFLADVPDVVTREALTAASVVRRTTASLLGAMLPDVPPQDAFDRLRTLPFVETRQDGLGLHDAVQTSLSTYLRSTDPIRRRRYRRAAWRQLRSEVRDAPPTELWRYTADMLYLIENPVIREAFFPSGAQPLAVEPATVDDVPSIELIARRHDGEEGAKALLDWYRVAPSAFFAIRDRDGITVAFSCLLNGRELLSSTVADPVTAGWRNHLRHNPPPAGQQVLGFRRWLDIDHGERPSSSQAASWLDVKRTYMELRPSLRRIYTVVEDPSVYLPIVLRLGFRPVGPDDGVATVGSRTFTSVVLDFGPDSVDGWLAGLVAAELGLDPDVAVDADGREVTLDGRTVRLTPLEFGVLRCLQEHDGKTVSRATLLDAVWGYESDVGSNVVDVVVKRLRAKLGEAGAGVETVRGSGYRWTAG